MLVPAPSSIIVDFPSEPKKAEDVPLYLGIGLP
jgi:hypothetical protein